jgi:two-component system NtrC family sensor kinase
MSPLARRKSAPSANSPRPHPGPAAAIPEAVFGHAPCKTTRAVDTPLAERRLADRLAIVGTLLPAIAQELGTPLGVVLARARLIETGALSPVDEARSGGIIAEQVGRMSRVIRRLLEFSSSRPGETADGRDQARVPLRTLVEDMTEMLRPMAHRRQITLRLQIGPSIAVRGDACLLQQALVNLLIKLIQEIRGPGELQLTLARGPATPPAMRPGDLRRNYAQVSARGPRGAMSPEAWDAFSGLTVPKGIISEQGGWLVLSRAARRGPGFTVYLPPHAS